MLEQNYTSKLWTQVMLKKLYLICREQGLGTLLVCAHPLEISMFLRHFEVIFAKYIGFDFSNMM
jgi:hypothetical protein